MVSIACIADRPIGQQTNQPINQLLNQPTDRYLGRVMCTQLKKLSFLPHEMNGKSKKKQESKQGYKTRFQSTITRKRSK